MKFPYLSRFKHPSSPNISDVERQSPSDTKTLQKWNKVFLFACALAISLDPLFLYILVIDRKRVCIKLDRNFQITAVVLRTAIDFFYILRIIFQCKEYTTSNPYGGVVQNIRGVAKRRYLKSYFIFDVLSILPLPQFVVLVLIQPKIGTIGFLVKGTINVMEIVILVQYVPRLIRIYPLYKELNYTSGMIIETAWAGAVSNLLLYLLSSHIIGALWYMWAIQRGFWCWKKMCKANKNCEPSNLLCFYQNEPHRFLLEQCAFIDPDNIKDDTQFNFGIFTDALASGVADSKDFPQKFIYCIWWGLRSVSSMGQNLKTSTFFWEVLFSIFISIAGLVLFALFIGNMQRYLQYLQSATERIQEMRLKKKDEDRWMSYRHLPDRIKERIKEYRQFKWQTTRGAAEEQALIASFPKDLSRDINRHIALRLFARVPRLKKMDVKILHALCDCLKSVLYSSNSCIIRQGDRVNEMIFFTSGNLESVALDGGRTSLNGNDFIGEALLNWALDPHSSSIHPISTIKVKTVSVVEAFTLEAEDLKSVASKFRLPDSTL